MKPGSIHTIDFIEGARSYLALRSALEPRKQHWTALTGVSIMWQCGCFVCVFGSTLRVTPPSLRTEIMLPTAHKAKITYTGKGIRQRPWKRFHRIFVNKRNVVVTPKVLWRPSHNVYERGQHMYSKILCFKCILVGHKKSAQMNETGESYLNILKSA